MLKGGIDLGHGGADSGAVFGDLIEKVINYKVGTKLAEYFRLNGIEPVMIRTGDSTLSLAQRCNILNNANVDFVISEHENAGGGDGFEVFHSINGGKGKILAENIAKQFSALGQNAHGGTGVKTRQGSNGDYYAMIRDTNAPAVITEFAFLDNTEDRKAIDEEREYENIARAICKGVCATFGLTFKDKVVVPPVAPPISKLSTQGTVIASVLNVRSSMTSVNSKNIIGTLIKGQKVHIDKLVGDWYSIYYGNHGGYVSAKYIKLI